MSKSNNDKKKEKKSEEIKKLPPNTLLCSNFEKCKSVVQIAEDEDKDLLFPLCESCEVTLVKTAARDDDLEEDTGVEEVEHGQYVPYELKSQDQAKVGAQLIIVIVVRHLIC
jgi:hypothetical protein